MEVTVLPVLSSQRREREILQQLEKKEESTLEIKETFTSLQEEVDLKTKKLNKVYVCVLCVCKLMYVAQGALFLKYHVVMT